MNSDDDVKNVKDLWMRLPPKWRDALSGGLIRMIQSDWELPSRWRERIAKSLVILCGAILALNLMFVLVAMTRAASSWPVTYAFDNDAGQAIDVLKGTRWTNDNGWYFYGPLYYRLSKLFVSLDPVYRLAVQHNDLGFVEASLHFSLMLVSLLSVLGTLALLAALCFEKRRMQFIAFVLLAGSLFASNTEWLVYVAAGHFPDFLLMFLVTAGTAAASAWARSETTADRNKWLLIAGLCWGAAGLTKVSAATFIPGLVLLVVIAKGWKRRSSYAQIGTFAIASLAVFVILGYPQSLNIKQQFAAYFYGASAAFSKPAEAYKVMTWLTYAWRYAHTLFLAIIALACLAGPIPGRRWNSAGILVILIPLSGFIFLLPISIIGHTHHYLYPVLGAVGVWLIAAFRTLAGSVYARFRFAGVVRGVAIASVALLAFKAAGMKLEDSVSVLYARYADRQSAQQTQWVIREYLSQNRGVIGDTYVPYDNSPSKYPPAIKWGWTLDGIAATVGSELFVTNKLGCKHFAQAEPSSWDLLDNTREQYQKKHEFYSLLLASNSFTDSRGRRWHLKDSMGIWDTWQLDRVPAAEPDYSAIGEVEGLLKTATFKLSVKPEPQQQQSEITIRGGAQVVPGPWTGSYAFRNSGQNLLLLPSRSLDLASGAIALWARISDKYDGTTLISVDRNNALYVWRSKNGMFSFIYDNKPMDKNGAPVLQDGGWHHYVCSWRAGRQELYVDGILMASGEVPASSAKTESVALGSLDSRPDEPFGDIAEAAVFSRPLTGNEAAMLYRAGIALVARHSEASARVADKGPL